MIGKPAGILVQKNTTVLKINVNSPLIEKIDYANPILFLEKLAHLSKPIFLDSVMQHKTLGRYSFIGIEPFSFIELRKTGLYWDGKFEQTQFFDFIEQLLEKYKRDPLSELPDFQGGLMGYIAYDICHIIEDIPNPRSNENSNIPLAMFGLYDLVLAFDHLKKLAWIISTGQSKESSSGTEEHARARIDFLKAQLAKPQLKKRLLATRFGFGTSNFTRETYIAAVEKIKNYILEGDVFQVNLSQKFGYKIPENFDALALYKGLRTSNPATFAAYFNFDNITILSSSPERLIKMREQHIEARPIKGTIKRSINFEEDRILSSALLASVKDRAENTMIVDLLRNDLSKVAKPGHVNVTKLCSLETYEKVHHLVSVIEAELDPKYKLGSLLKALLPGGSITGAPKIRAMEIIYECESVNRAIYCGNVGYLGFNQNIDLSIAIRTIQINEDNLSYQVGGAVVLDSDPEAEYQETLQKGAAIRDAIENYGH